MGCSARTDEKGFTLIELLIVVAIIGVLAAIAIPNLIVGQQRARYSRAAGDTRLIITQAQVLTSDYNQTPITGLALAMPAALWDGSTPPGGGNGTRYMALVNDVWAPGTPCFSGAAGEACYQFAEVAGPAGGPIGPGDFVFTSHSVGADSANDSAGWNGQAAPVNDDLGTSSLIGCAFGPALPIAGPC